VLLLLGVPPLVVAVACLQSREARKIYHHWLLMQLVLLCFLLGQAFWLAIALLLLKNFEKNCLGCGKYTHALCGRVLEEDEGLLPADSVVCLGN
jgi:hypothetical protein